MCWEVKSYLRGFFCLLVVVNYYEVFFLNLLFYIVNSAIIFIVIISSINIDAQKIEKQVDLCSALVVSLSFHIHVILFCFINIYHLIMA